MTTAYHIADATSWAPHGWPEGSFKWDSASGYSVWLAGAWVAVPGLNMPTGASAMIAFPVLASANALSVGPVLMGTTENTSRRFYPVAGLFTLTAKTGTMVGVASCSVGTNARPATGIGLTVCTIRVALEGYYL